MMKLGLWGVEMGDDETGDNDKGGRGAGNHEVEMKDAINDSENGDGKEDDDEGRDDGIGVVGVKMGEDCNFGDRVDGVRDEEMQRGEAQEDDEGRGIKEVQEEWGDGVKENSQDGVGLYLESLKPDQRF